MNNLIMWDQSAHWVEGTVHLITLFGNDFNFVIDR